MLLVKHAARRLVKPSIVRKMEEERKDGMKRLRGYC
jgi:hypothetical protein